MVWQTKDFTVVDLEPADYGRAEELVLQHADLPLGAADASVVAIAERLGITEMTTLDRRHFDASTHHEVTLTPSAAG